MHVEQKHVTIVDLHDHQPREFVLLREAEGYRLTAVSAAEIVNVLLSDEDLRKLRQEVGKGAQDPFAEAITAMPRQQRGYQTDLRDWLSFN